MFVGRAHLRPQAVQQHSLHLHCLGLLLQDGGRGVQVCCQLHISNRSKWEANCSTDKVKDSLLHTSCCHCR